MKIRLDYVTNSSSSSFVIQTNAEVPEQYKNNLKHITKENVLDVFRELSWFDEEDYFGNGATYAELQSLSHITDDQLFLIYLIQSSFGSKFLEVMEYLNKSNKPVYYMCVDRDWYWKQDKLCEFVNNARREEKEEEEAER